MFWSILTVNVALLCPLALGEPALAPRVASCARRFFTLCVFAALMVDLLLLMYLRAHVCVCPVTCCMLSVVAERSSIMARFIVLAMLPMIFANEDATGSRALRGTEVCSLGQCRHMCIQPTHCDTAEARGHRKQFNIVSHIMCINLRDVHQSTHRQLLYRFVGWEILMWIARWHGIHNSVGSENPLKIR